MNIPTGVIVSVKMFMDKMTDTEVVVQYQGLVLGYKSMRGTLGYEKIEELYDQHYTAGDQMHELTKEAFLRLAAERLNL